MMTPPEHRNDRRSLTREIVFLLVALLLGLALAFILVTVIEWVVGDSPGLQTYPRGR